MSQLKLQCQLHFEQHQRLKSTFVLVLLGRKLKNKKLFFFISSVVVTSNTCNPCFIGIMTWFCFQTKRKKNVILDYIRKSSNYIYLIKAASFSTKSTLFINQYIIIFYPVFTYKCHNKFLFRIIAKV